MISCLQNLIGVRDLAGYNQPDSSYFINDLPGITTAQLEAISDQGDQYEPRLAWDDILDRASRSFESDVKKYLKPVAKNYSYRQRFISGEIDYDNTTLATENFYSGWHFDLYGRSENIELVIESATLTIVSGVDFEIKIWDAITGELLDSSGYDLDAVTSFPDTFTYKILFKVPIWLHPNIFVGYDASKISVKQVARFRNTGSVSAVHVSNTAPIVRGNFTGANTGLILTYNLGCSVDNFVCQRVDLFTDPFVYKLGIEFCRERIYSDRINRWTQLNKQQAVDLKEKEFEREYNKIMESIFTDIRLDSHDECFECAKALDYKTNIP